MAYSVTMPELQRALIERALRETGRAFEVEMADQMAAWPDRQQENPNQMFGVYVVGISPEPG